MKILEISRSGQLYLGQWHQTSLKFFGKTLITREMRIIGNLGGGHS